MPFFALGADENEKKLRNTLKEELTMKIKEIAEAYDVEYESIDPKIIHSIFFNQENACKIIERLRFECVPILGCDVYRMKDGEMAEILMPNLYVNKSEGESCREYLLRSCDEALNFIKNYSQYTNDINGIYFDLVV